MFRPSVALVAAMLLLSGLAGCLAATDAGGGAADSGAPVDPLAAIAAAAPHGPAAAGAAGASKWYVASVTASPDGGLGAFWWTLPEGAAVPWAMNDVFRTKSTVVALEVAPVVAPEHRALVKAWGMLAYELEEGQLAAGGGYIDLPHRAVTRQLDAPPVEEETFVNLDPTFVHIARDPAQNESIAVLVFAVADEPVPFSLAWRVLDHDPEDDEEPAPDAEAFVAARSAPAARFEPRAGSGFHAQIYQHVMLGAGATGSAFEFELWIGDVKAGTTSAIRGGLGPYGVHAAPQGRLDSGWALAYADHIGFGVAASEFSIEAAARGESVAGSGHMVEAWPAIFVGSGLGIASAFVVQDGEGASSARLDVTGVRADGTFVYDGAGVLEFGSTLEALFDAPAREQRLYGTEGTIEPPFGARSWVHTPLTAVWTDALAAAAGKA